METISLQRREKESERVILSYQQKEKSFRFDALFQIRLFFLSLPDILMRNKHKEKNEWEREREKYSNVWEPLRIDREGERQRVSISDL